MVAFATFLFVACSKPSPVDEAISLIEEATEQVEKAKNITELESISQDFETKFDALDRNTRISSQQQRKRKRWKRYRRSLKMSCRRK